MRKQPKLAVHLPDVEIFYEAVRTALDHGEFFAADDLRRASVLLEAGRARARQLSAGQTPWLTQSGPTALGYVSALDGSVQPYGLHLPEGFAARPAQHWRLDTWFHGRAEKLSEVNFIAEVSKSGGQFVRPDALVLQPYGRYCNAAKLAGEVDFFEALADVRRRFRIDEDRIVIRGFSMGGATAWHLGAHFASDWAAIAPGAGFAETPLFLAEFQKEKVDPSWWERKLWQMYDAPAWAENFRNVATVAYSGEIDKQRQAAEVMAGALDKVGVPLVHVIGPGTGHSYHPAAKLEIDRLVDALAARGRDRMPRRVSLVTTTLRYPRQAWVTALGLGQHWDKATIEAAIVGDAEVTLTTRNVSALGLDMPPATAPFPAGGVVVVRLDGQRLQVAGPRSDRSWRARFFRTGTRWQAGEPLAEGLRKSHGLQGPIDDAFLTSFLFVTPSGAALSKEVARWTDDEQMRAIREWRRQMRGEPRVKRDSDVTADDIANHNLILWGDPGSNLFIRQLVNRLPIQWDRGGLTAGKRRWTGDKHALVAIYPNPLNPARYVVLNSGFTYREYDYLNNARQVPKLPDWAVVDVSTPVSPRAPGKIADADFFDDRWQLRAPTAGPRVGQTAGGLAKAP